MYLVSKRAQQMKPLQKNLKEQKVRYTTFNHDQIKPHTH